jgi:hypothetical protein
MKQKRSRTHKHKHRKDRWLKVDKICARWSRQYRRRRFGQRRDADA